MKLLYNHWLILSLLLIILFTRLSLLNKNAVDFWADERHYRQLIAELKKAELENNYKIALQTIFHLNARPALGMFYYPSAFLEWKNPNIPFGIYFNLLVNISALILIFLIIKKFQGENAAFFVTLLITLSLSSVVYMRHLLAYDIALLVLLIGFYMHIAFKKFFIPGILVGLTFLTYPGYYYYLIPIPLMVFFYYHSIKKTLIFILGIGVILLFTQIAYSAASETTSYLQSLKEESAGGATANYGEFIPAAAYIGEYIFNIDGYWNIVLLLAIFPGLLLIKKRKKLLFLFGYLIIVFLILELYSHILQKNVLFGRTIRPFYLLALLLSALVLERLLVGFKSVVKYRLGISILVILTIINWWPKFLIYKNLIYPAQFKNQAKEFLKEKYGNFVVEEALFVNYFGINSPPRMKMFTEYKDGEPGKFYIINANQIFPYFGSYDLNLFCKNEALLKVPHAQSIFKPYLFEGHKKIMRERMDIDPLYYQLIYCK